MIWGSWKVASWARLARCAHRRGCRNALCVCLTRAGSAVGRAPLALGQPKLYRRSVDQGGDTPGDEEKQNEHED